jgi:hypothetical protein
MSTDILITLGATVAGLISFVVVMGRREKAAMGAADHFQVKGFEATIDRACGESWCFSAHPMIAYLVIKADGAAFWASGDAPLLEPVERPLFNLTGERLNVSSGDDHRSFPVPANRPAPLQALQQRGIVRMGRVLTVAPPTGY